MIAVVRVRGTVNIKPDIRKTLENLMLFKPNTMAVVSDSQKKMVEKAKDYVTFGFIDEKALAMVLEKRGYTEEGKKVDLEYLKSKNISSFAELSNKVINGSVRLREVGIVPCFRLHPPKKGWERKGIKMPFNLGGALGNRGEYMNELVFRMI
jgi:large subunit ribosomal protein L30